jgi:hypothetical protein
VPAQEDRASISEEPHLTAVDEYRWFPTPIPMPPRVVVRIRDDVNSGGAAKDGEPWRKVLFVEPPKRYRRHRDGQPPGACNRVRLKAPLQAQVDRSLSICMQLFTNQRVNIETSRLAGKSFLGGLDVLRPLPVSTNEDRRVGSHIRHKPFAGDIPAINHQAGRLANYRPMPRLGMCVGRRERSPIALVITCVSGPPGAGSELLGHGPLRECLVFLHAERLRRRRPPALGNDATWRRASRADHAARSGRAGVGYPDSALSSSQRCHAQRHLCSRRQAARRRKEGS